MAAPRQFDPGRGLAMAGLLGLTGFAFVQPVLSVFGENPTVFAAANIDEWRLVVLVFGIALVPGLALGLVWVALRALHPPTGDAFLVAAVGGLFGLASMQWMKAIELPSAALRISVSLGLGLAFAAAYARLPNVRSWTALTVPLVLAAPVLLVVASPSADLIGQPEYSFEPRSGEGNPNVVMLVLDELPTLSLLNEAGDIDPERFPNLAAFAATSTWYRDFTTVAPHTDIAVPSMLSGQWPQPVAPLLSNYPDNLFTAFAPTHELAVFERITQLCSFDACGDAALGDGNTAADFGEVLRHMGSVWVDRIHPTRTPEIAFDEFEESVLSDDAGADELSDVSGFEAVFGQEASLAKPERFERFLGSLHSDGSRPSLFYMHLVFPHYPFRFFPDGSDYQPIILPEVPYAGRLNSSPWVAALDETRHLLQVQYVDALVGQFVDRLRDQDLFDDSLIVIVSDHGASFQPDTSYRSSAAESLGSVAFAPLLIKAPGQESGIVDTTNVTSVDVLPTLAQLAGVELDFSVDGFIAGSPEIDDRGDTKLIWDKPSPPQGPKLTGPPLEFSAAATRPDVSLRSVWAPDGERAGEGLDRIAGVSAMVGEPFAPDGVLDDVVLAVALAEQFENPTTVTPIGVVQGEVRGAVSGPLVFSVDGVIVGGSPVFALRATEQSVAMLLPQDVVGTAFELRAGVLQDGGLYELLIEGW